MSHTVFPKSFWRYALNTACHTLNRVPSTLVDKTQYELWKGNRPNLSYIKVWGCNTYMKGVESDKQEDEAMAEPAFDEAYIGNGKLSISKDTTTLRKLSKVICPPQRYDLLITNDALLIKKDEPTTYAERSQC
ncbi:putative polyprotein [Abeliophyllum distichum]|uniref:Polyprotein n=1 Tax=Abeliophyllum distichum TaxID=126358 RepID=A0ABD1SAW3_9LAMI